MPAILLSLNSPSRQGDTFIYVWLWSPATASQSHTEVLCLSKQRILSTPLYTTTTCIYEHDCHVRATLKVLVAVHPGLNISFSSLMALQTRVQHHN